MVQTPFFDLPTAIFFIIDTGSFSCSMSVALYDMYVCMYEYVLTSLDPLITPSLFTKN